MSPPGTLSLLGERTDIEDYKCLLIIPGLHVSLILLPFSFKQVITADHGFDVVHFDPVGRLFLKDQIVIDQVEDPITPGVFKK